MGKQKSSYLPPKAGPRNVTWLWSNEEWFAKFPALYELLASGIYEGDPRKPASLSLFVSEGRLKAVVRDRHTRQALWLTLEGNTDVISEIEALIVSGGGEWRPFKEGQDDKVPF